MITRSSLFIYLTLLISIYLTFGQDFAFPENQVSDKRKQNAQGRKPVWVPNKCANNEILYPGDGKDDWICDCKPAHIYHPQTQQCYLAYRKGPCSEGKMFILQKKVVPECVNNPCSNHNQIIYNETCYDYGSTTPCHAQFSEALEIDTNTLKPKCVQRSESPLLTVIIERFTLTDRVDVDEIDETYPEGATELYKNAIPCQKATKRFINGTCPKE